jgi:hypothetical protein
VGDGLGDEFLGRVVELGVLGLVVEPDLGVRELVDQRGDLLVDRDRRVQVIRCWPG